ncbi:MAG TPA: hypothetical protein PKX23_03420 [Verrucomicrobiota bacterium]|jgi:hypothetical protein|nr:hypothetical protein [Verrucomicrobiota bacterium]HRT08332.1 hypothetical protein [Candidatus Paceibacterota bacterium]HRT57618.1 hypothetical protein [Candidatus Paceibacterota bacterium]
MILLAQNCLVFETPDGGVPFTPDMISVEVSGQDDHGFGPEFIEQAASAVFHYFKHDQGRLSITIAEFAEAMEKVLAGFSPAPPTPSNAAASPEVRESDLRQIARESGGGFELVFFPRLRHELRQQLSLAPRVLRFRGLRGCVKDLLGARRWTPKCRALQDQIVCFLRECLSAEPRQTGFALVVE